MNRVTKTERIAGHTVHYISDNDIFEITGCPGKITGFPILRLSAYEDTGLEPGEMKMAFNEDAVLKLAGQALGMSPDRLRELAQADREGRCGIPPVKLHQKIFRVFNGEIYEEMVRGAIWEPFMPQPRWKVFVMGSGLPYYWDDVFGKTVFLTREAAEVALEEREMDK